MVCVVCVVWKMKLVLIVLLCSRVRETVYPYFQGSGGAECHCKAAGQVAGCVPEYVKPNTTGNILNTNEEQTAAGMRTS